MSLKEEVEATLAECRSMTDSHPDYRQMRLDTMKKPQIPNRQDILDEATELIAKVKILESRVNDTIWSKNKAFKEVEYFYNHLPPAARNNESNSKVKKYKAFSTLIDELHLYREKLRDARSQVQDYKNDVTYYTEEASGLKISMK